jgi:hypothetical protein
MHKHLPKIALLLLLTFIASVGFAQKKTVTGFVTDSATNAPLANVQVSNLTDSKKTTTDGKGKFSLSVDVNDILFFTKDDYKFQSFRYNLLMEQTLQVRMSVLPHILPGVTVQASYSKYQSDSVKRLDDFNKELVSPQYKAVQNNSSGAGAVVNLDFFTSKEKSKRRAVKLFEEHEKDAYVTYRFSPELVTAYTGLKGDSLTSFIQLHAPEYKWLRKHTTDEDVLYYINDQLKVFYKRKEN